MPVKPKEQPITLEDLLHDLARRDFKDFLRFVKIQDTGVDSGAAVAFEQWPHLMALAETFDKQRLLIILKARQVGVSWLIAAYVLWVALYHPGTNVLLLSMGELESKELLGKVKFIYNNLPKPLQEPVITNSTTQFAFARFGSIKALPATEHAGSGETSTLVVQDEADKHAHLEKNFSAIRPTIDAGGQHIMVSSANPWVADSFFREMYRKANTLTEDNQSRKDGKNSYARVFLGWNVRPGRDGEWYARQKADYDLDQLRKEYPETEQDALAAPSSISAFDAEMLDRMRATQLPALSISNAPAHAHIYEKFIAGRKYAMGTDTAHGVGKDYSVSVVMDVDRGSVVADVFTNQLEPDDFATESFALYEMYSRPIWGIEDNDWGILVIRKAQELGARNLYHRPVSRLQPNKKGMAGWHTDEQHRAILWGDLVSWVKAGRLVVLSPEGLNQFYNVIWKPDKTTGKLRIEAQQGAHDDYPTAVGIAIQVSEKARRSTGYLPEEGETVRKRELVRVRRRW